jgi:hypothetical protein
MKTFAFLGRLKNTSNIILQIHLRAKLNVTAGGKYGSKKLCCGNGCNIFSYLSETSAVGLYCIAPVAIKFVLHFGGL